MSAQASSLRGALRVALPHLDEALRKEYTAVKRLIPVSHWAKRTFSLFLLAGALAMPLATPQARSIATRVTTGSFLPRPVCPGAPVGC
jgi:hypothetical protein